MIGTDTKVLGFSDGVGLAVQMLDQLQHNPDIADQCSLEEEYRSSGGEQKNIVLEYLDAARGGGREVERGFAAVMTDFVAACRGGCVPDTKNYVPWSEVSDG